MRGATNWLDAQPPAPGGIGSEERVFILFYFYFISSFVLAVLLFVKAAHLCIGLLDLVSWVPLLPPLCPLTLQPG